MDDPARQAQLQADLCRLFAVPPHVLGFRSRPARLRFRLARLIDGIAIWLTEHHHDRVAIAVWKLSGLW